MAGLPTASLMPKPISSAPRARDALCQHTSVHLGDVAADGVDFKDIGAGFEHDVGGIDLVLERDAVDGQLIRAELPAEMTTRKRSSGVAWSTISRISWQARSPSSLGRGWPPT